MENVNDISNENTNFIKALSRILEIDVILGLSRVDDDIFTYKITINIFFDYLMKECERMAKLLSEKEIKSFGTTIHAMKSMLSTIGAMRLSDMALELEMAAIKGEADYCYANYPLLHQKLLSLYNDLKSLEVF